MDHPHFWFVSCFGVNEEEDNRILRNSLFDPPRGAISGYFRYPKWKFQFFRSRGHSSSWINPIFGLWVVLGSMRRKTTGFTIIIYYYYYYIIVYYITTFLLLFIITALPRGSRASDRSGLEYVGVRKLNISTNVPCMTIQQDTEHFLKIHCSISFNFGF